VAILLQARKFFCVGDRCRRKIFTEPLPGTVARYARRSCRSSEALHWLTLALAGRAGARLARRLGLLACRSTLLRSLRHRMQPTTVTASYLACIMRIRNSVAISERERAGHRLVLLIRSSRQILLVKIVVKIFGDFITVARGLFEIFLIQNFNLPSPIFNQSASLQISGYHRHRCTLRPQHHG
jgi:hypothetical protein